MSVLLLRPNQLYHHLPRCAHISPPMVNWGWLHAISCQCSKVMAAYPRANVVSVPQGWALQGVCIVGGAPSIITTDAWGWRVYRGGHGSVHHAGSAASHLGKGAQHRTCPYAPWRSYRPAPCARQPAEVEFGCAPPLRPTIALEQKAAARQGQHYHQCRGRQARRYRQSSRLLT